jgi:periplasmic copper chaperone A
MTRSVNCFARPALLAAALFAAVTGAARSAAAQAATVTAKDVWVREAPAGRPTTAVFLVLTNSGTTARHVVSGATAAADTLELHEMKRDGNMMQMSPVSRITVPAGGDVTLRPGGLHLMLFGLRKPLVAGDTIRVSLTLDDGTKLEVPAEVRAMMGRMP